MNDQGVEATDLVVDSNYLVAVVDERDSLHGQAEPMDAWLERSERRILYFDCIVAEAISVLARRFQERKRVSEFMPVLKALTNRTRDHITWVSPRIPEVYEAVVGLVAQSEGLLNFNDAFLAIIMREQGLKYVLSFDPDFDTVEWVSRLGTLRHLEEMAFPPPASQETVP